MQHEIDHLNGILFINHLSRLKLERIRKKLKKPNSRTKLGKSLFKVVFAGTPDFAVSILSGLIASHHVIVAVLTQPDRPAVVV